MAKTQTKTKRTTAKKNTPKVNATSGQQPTNAGNTGNAQVSEKETAFTPVLDVDVANVKPGSGKGEVGPVILPGFWVRLGNHDDVPDRFVGHLAVVLDGPWAPVPIGVKDSGIAGYTFDKDKKYTVRTRDEASSTLVVDADALQNPVQDRVELQPFA